MALQLCVGLVEDGHVLMDLYSVIVTILYTICLQLDARDNIYIQHLTILNDSNLVGECQACLLDTITLAHASATNWSTNQDSASQKCGKQGGKKKDASLLTTTNLTTPRRRALVQPQSPSPISAPFPQSSVSAQGNGGTML